MPPPTRLQVGIDFSRKQADLALLQPDGQLLDKHQAFANSLSGYQQAKVYLLQHLSGSDFSGVDLAGEATSYYWLPYYLQLVQDPQLAPFGLRLFLLNPAWVKWYKKCFPADNKSDTSDPFYIADRLRTLASKLPWQYQPEQLPLRFYTRYRFHLSQDLSREKNYYQLFLFLAHSGYSTQSPFVDVFGSTSQYLLQHPDLLASLSQLELDNLTACLHTISGHHLPNPAGNAARLKAALNDSLPLPSELQEPVQRILDSQAQLIEQLQARRDQVDQWISAEVQANHPAVAWLTSIPGVGPVFGGGICAEIGNLERFTQVERWDPQRKSYRRRTLREVEDAVAKYAGLWWPQNASGDFVAEERRMSKKGNAYLRYYILEAADRMRQRIPSYSRYYQRKFEQATKHQHKRALVLTGRKAVGLLVGLLHHQECYRPEEA